MSIRHDIMQALKARLELIVNGSSITVNGASHTFASSPKKVEIWRKHPYSTAQVPAIAIYDTDQVETDDGVIGLQEWDLTATVAGFFSQAEPAESVRTLMDDMVAAIGGDYRLGGLARDIRIPTVKMLEDETGADVVAGCELTLQISYRAPQWSL